MNNNEVLERELGWDDEIQNDGPEFTVLPAGDYSFEVTNWERARYTPKEGAKLPPCNQAILFLKLTATDGKTTTVKHNLYLHTQTEGLLCSFFASIGARKSGDKYRMDWNTVMFASGRAKVGIREWKNKDGETMQSNEIKKFYPNDAPQAPTRPLSMTDGDF